MPVLNGGQPSTLEFHDFFREAPAHYSGVAGGFSLDLS